MFSVAVVHRKEQLSVYVFKLQFSVLVWDSDYFSGSGLNYLACNNSAPTPIRARLETFLQKHELGECIASQLAFVSVEIRDSRSLFNAAETCILNSF